MTEKAQFTVLLAAFAVPAFVQIFLLGAIVREINRLSESWSLISSLTRQILASVETTKKSQPTAGDPDARTGSGT